MPTTQPKGVQRCWDFGPLQKHLLQDSKSAERGGTLFPSPRPFFVSRVHTGTRSSLMQILWVCGSSVYVSLCCWRPCSWKLYCINALAREAHDESMPTVRLQRGGLSQGCRWVWGGEVGQGGDWESSGKGVEPQSTQKYEVKRREICSKECWTSVQKMLALWHFNPDPPPPPLKCLHPPTLPSLSHSCPLKGKMKTDRWTHSAPAWVDDCGLAWCCSTQVNTTQGGWYGSTDTGYSPPYRKTGKEETIFHF